MNQCLVCKSDAVSTYCSLSCSNRARPAKNRLRYYSNPKPCRVCCNPLPYEKRFYNVFCSSACAATYNNKIRVRKRKPKPPPKPTSAERSTSRFLAGETSTRAGARHALIRLRGDKCQECSQSAVWNSKPLVLVVDHQNGHPGDNSPDNLRLLCPNCNSQSLTFSGRNRGKGRKSRGLPR
jgi:hypothetical protein